MHSGEWISGVSYCPLCEPIAAEIIPTVIIESVLFHNRAFITENRRTIRGIKNSLNEELYTLTNLLVQ